MWEEDVECPNCGEMFSPGYDDAEDMEDECDQLWFNYHETCPHCGRKLCVAMVYRFMTADVMDEEDEE